jgi:hypothetical protein
METHGQALEVFIFHRRCKLLPEMFVVHAVAGDNALQMGERDKSKGENFLLARRQVLIAAAFALSIVVIVVFGIRAFHQAPRKKSSERIRPWMSIKYVARAHRVPPQVLYEALDLPPKTQDKRSIKQIARAQNLPVEEVILVLQKAIERARPASAPTPAHTSPTSVIPGPSPDPR